MSMTSKTTPRTTQPLRTTGSPGPLGTPTPTRATDIVRPAVEVKQAAQTRTAGGAGIDDVRKRAYEIYMARRTTGSPGGPESDWLQAERELRVRA